MRNEVTLVYIINTFCALTIFRAGPLNLKKNKFHVRNILRRNYNCTTTVLQHNYGAANYRSVQVNTVNTVTTSFVGKSHGLLMNSAVSKARRLS